MQRKLNREETVRTNLFLTGKAFYWPFTWEVYEAYEDVEQRDGTAFLKARAKEGRRYKPQVARSYQPLVEEPHLFLRFARLWEQRNVPHALTEWIAQYGLLGLTPSKDPRFPNTPKGGSEDTINATKNEAKKAHYTLTLYEAALSRDKERLERTLLPEEKGPEWLEEKRRYHHERMRKKGIGWVDALVDFALAVVIMNVEPALNYFTYPKIYPTVDYTDELLTPERLVGSWAVRNLLGAMYLQFYWLITSGGKLCEYCGHLIPPETAVSNKQGTRKTRSDKKFCSEHCYQNHYYHNKRKPNRQKTQPSG